MSNFRPLQYINSKTNKENNNKTPKKQFLKPRLDIYVEDTPSPKIKKKVLTMQSSSKTNSNLFRRKILDTPTNSQTQCSQKKPIKRLFDPNALADELPGYDGNDDETLIGNETYVTKRAKDAKISNLFKPKLAENQLLQNNGCDDSFETLKKREQRANRKIIRLSEVLSVMDISENNKTLNNSNAKQINNKHGKESALQNITNKNNYSNKSMNFYSFSTNSLTNVTKDSYFHSNVNILNNNSNNKITSPTGTGTITTTRSSTSPITSTEKSTTKNKTISPTGTADITTRTTVRSSTSPSSEQSMTKNKSTSSTGTDSVPSMVTARSSLSTEQSSTKTTRKTNSFSENQTNISKTIDDSNSNSHSLDKTNRQLNITKTIEKLVNESTQNLTSISEFMNNNTFDSPSFYVNKNIIPDTNADERILEKYTQVNVNKNLYSHKRKLYITYTNLTKMQLKILKQIVENNFKANTIIEKLLSLKTTHLIVGNGNNNQNNSKINADAGNLSPKILLAVLNNCKIVRFDWAMQSSNEKKWFNESDFIPNEYKIYNEKYLKYKFEQKCINLFSNYENIYLCQYTLKEILREQLCEIFIKFCAHITSRPNKATLVIINKDNVDVNMLLKNEFECLVDKKIPIVAYEWVLDCAWTFEKLSIENYIVDYT